MEELLAPGTFVEFVYRNNEKTLQFRRVLEGVRVPLDKNGDPIPGEPEIQVCGLEIYVDGRLKRQLTKRVSEVDAFVRQHLQAGWRIVSSGELQP